LELIIKSLNQSSLNDNQDGEPLSNIFLNRRHDNRYIVSEFPVKDIGSIIEISRLGMKIRKLHSEDIPGPVLAVPIVDHDIEAEIVWQDKNYIGLRYEHEFDVAHLVETITKKIKEPEISSKKTILDHEIASYTKKDIFSPFINLMAELENPDTDITKLQAYVEEISKACRQTNVQEGKVPDEVEESTGTESGTGEPANLEETLIHEARIAFSETGTEIKDADFAIARLGLNSVRKISTDFIRNNISELKFPLSNFTNYESYHILTIVIFKHLTHFFNYNDKQGHGSLLLATETKGLDILMNVSSEDSSAVKNYYISPQRVYSEISRLYEKKQFGRDLLLVNKYHFETKLGMFEDIYDGYILAHLIFNPFYTISSSIKFTFTKKKLVYSFLAYLTMIATTFIIDKGKESGAVLIKKLTRTGMDEGEIMVFLNERINEVNDILKNLGLSGKIANVTLPHSSVKSAGYLPKDIHSKYFMKSFEDFTVMKSIKRMALQYEDDAYTHFILNKLMIAGDFGLNAKIYCVIPCRNIAHDELYLEDFSFFDFVVFKDIDNLPESHMKEFVKLWESFEGKIIVTFSKYSFLDFNNPELYLLLKNHIVDFPSYFSNIGIYEKMIDHTANYLKPYMLGHEVDRNRYLNEVCSMDYIKRSELPRFS
jgi:hypothetical protein